MSASNGHLPDGAVVATLDMLRRANRAYRRLPRTSEIEGADVYVQIRVIRHASYLEFLPSLPNEAKDWPKEDEARAEAYERWLTAQSPEFRRERQATVLRVSYRVIAAGVSEPEVTEETAVEFAADADWLANEILVFSGILKETPKPEPKPEPDPEPVPA